VAHRFDVTDVFSPHYRIAPPEEQQPVAAPGRPSIALALRGGVIACAASALVLALLVIPLPHHGSLDIDVLHAMNRFAAAIPLHDLQWHLNDNEIPQLLLAAGAMMLWNRRAHRKWSRDLTMLAVSACVITYVVSRVVQHFVDRPRPLLEVQLIPFVNTAAVEEVRASFTHFGSLPSDHAALYAIASVVAFSVSRRAGFVVLAIGAWGALFRVAAGFHWPSDIAAGALLGTAVAVLVLRFADVFQPLMLQVHRAFRRAPELLSALGFIALAEFGASFPITKTLFRGLFHARLFH
jgi:membrane-associated phospholipid phosphatase